MTVRELYDAALIEINKLEAPSMLLEDYNYYINKAIQQYINKAYNRYEINQQATDDLLALKNSVTKNVESEKSPIFPGESKHYYVTIPNDYWHMLSCAIEFNTSETDKCKNNKTELSVLRKLTAEIAPTIITNAYFKPSYKCPYYSISSVISEDNILNEILFGDGPNCERPGNNKDITMDLMVGTSKYTPSKVYINYLKVPQIIYLSEDDLYGEDKTEKMEFPEYVCYEIINEFVKLLLENTADPRLSTNVPINQTVIPPVSE